MLLIIPPLPFKGRCDYPPLGCFYLSSFLRRWNGIETKIVDFSIEDFSYGRLDNIILNFVPDMIGISITTVLSKNGFNIAHYIKKEYPSTLVIMGGTHATMLPEDCLKVCDVVVRGEGEITLSEITDGSDVRNIKGVSYKLGKKIVHNPKREFISNLDNLPFPKYELSELKKYASYPEVSMMSSRGCPFDCTFCCSPCMWERKLRVRTPKNIVDEIEYLRDDYGAEGISFVDDTLNIPPERGIKICAEIVKRKLNRDMFFDCQLRANKQFVSEELFKRLKQANFRKIHFGVESGSLKVLKALNKRLTLSEVKRAVRISQNSGLETFGFFMVGNWNEGWQDVLKTWKLIFETNIRPGFAINTPFPKTVFYETLKKNGYIPDNIDWSMATTGIPFVRTDKMSKAEILLAFNFSWFLFNLLGRGLRLKD